MRQERKFESVPENFVISFPKDFDPYMVSDQQDNTHFHEYGNFLRDVAFSTGKYHNTGKPRTILYTPFVLDEQTSPERIHPAIQFLEVPFAVATGVASGQLQPESPLGRKTTDQQTQIVHSLGGLMDALQIIHNAHLPWEGPYSLYVGEKVNLWMRTDFGNGEELQLSRTFNPQDNTSTFTVSWYERQLNEDYNLEDDNFSYSAEIRSEITRGKRLDADVLVNQHFWKRSDDPLFKDRLILDKSKPRQNIVDTYLGKLRHHVHLAEGSLTSLMSAQREIAEELGISDLLDFDPYLIYPSGGKE